MSRTKRSNPPVGLEYWSRRPFSGWGVSRHGNSWVKRKTHKIERMRAKSEILNTFSDYN